MITSHIVQTTIVNPERPEFSFATVAIKPANTNVTLGLTDAEALGISTIRDVARREIDDFLLDLPRYLAGFFLDDAPALDARAGELRAILEEEGIDFAYLNEVVFGRNIIVEQSVPSLESLGALVKQSPGVLLGYASGAGIAADLGLTGGLGHLLVLGTAAGGLVIFGAAEGIAKALREGLYERLLSKLTGRTIPVRRRRGRGSARPTVTQPRSGLRSRPSGEVSSSKE
jgi:hypothetical protein